jgi:transcriptional regulator with XRE-family HTH domain
MSDEQRQELRRFLKDRRARIRPADAGLPMTPRRRVRGLRREEVAALAGIGVSWYTALENGDAHGVSESTLLAVANALALSASERHYLLVLAGQSETIEPTVPLDPLVMQTLQSIAFPAYIITPTWDVVAYNSAFGHVWAIGEGEALPFNAIERLFIHPAARAMHGANFISNITPVIGMLRSAVGRRPEAHQLRGLRDRLLTDEALAAMWNEYPIRGPLQPNSCSIESPIGPFRYDALTLPIPDTQHGLVIQVPDQAHRASFASSGRLTPPGR